MTAIRVMIADDSVVYRSQIKAALAGVAEIEVTGAASNGRFAVERMIQSPCDLLILDLEMPEMDGIATLKELRRRGVVCKVLVFSSSSKRGAESTMEALRLGAQDFVAKPSSGAGDPMDVNPSEKIRSVLLPKIKAIFARSTWLEPSPPLVAAPAASYPKIFWSTFRPKIVVVGSSTGGPAVLESIFSRLGGPLACPMVIAQHMPPIFTETLAERMSHISGIPVQEAKQGAHLEPGHVYLAPGDYHLRLEGTPDKILARLDQGPQINWVRPAVDPLFETAAEIFKERCLGIVLTGMGHDGRAGAEAVKRNGGAVVIQSESTCTVFGMPGAVFEAKAYDRIASPDEIIAILREKAGGPQAGRQVVGG